jgi:2-methylcitrate dehydratase
MGPATALACGRLIGLNPDELSNALSLALVPNVPLGVSRWGALSMMKGCATAFAVRSGVFAAFLAREGLTSSPEPFQGIFGLHHMTGAFEPRLPVMPGGPSVVEMSHQKPIPAETQALALLELVPRIRQFANVDDIDTIIVDLPQHAADHIGDPPKYDPQTRETADHSLPYMLAVALVDGEITLDSYRPERFLDPLLRPVMQKIVIRADDELSELRRTAQYGVTRPAPARILIRTRTGAEMYEEVAYYKGHWKNPMTRDDIDAKLDIICAGVATATQTESIRSAWWNVAEAEDIAESMQTLWSFDAEKGEE